MRRSVRAKTKILEDRFIVTITGRSLEGIGFAVQDNRGVPAFGWRLLTSARLEELTAFVKRTCRLIPERPALCANRQEHSVRRQNDRTYLGKSSRRQQRLDRKLKNGTVPRAKQSMIFRLRHPDFGFATSKRLLKRSMAPATRSADPKPQ